MTDLNDSSVSTERVVQRFEDLLHIYTEQFVSLQQLVTKQGAEVTAQLQAQNQAINQLQQSVSRLQLDCKEQSAVKSLTTTVFETHERQVTRLTSVLENVFQQSQQNQNRPLNNANAFGGFSNGNELSQLQQLQAAQVAQQHQQQLALAALMGFQQQQQQQFASVAPTSVVQAAPVVNNEVKPTPAVNALPAQQVKPVLPAQQVKPTPPAQESGFGNRFAKKEGEWDCKACYVRNPADKAVCPCCQTPKNGVSRAAEAKPAAPAFKPTTFAPQANTGGLSFGIGSGTAATLPGAVPTKPAATPAPAQTTTQQSSVNFSFNPNNATKPATPISVAKPGQVTASVPTTTASNTNSPVPFSFKGFGTPNSTLNSPNTTSLFGSATQSPNQSVNDSKPSLFGSKGLAFGNLSKQSEGNSFLSGKSNEGAFKVDPKQHPVFQTKAANDTSKTGEEEDAPEAFNPDDTQFVRPDIKVPDLVEVKTGEEAEEVLFCSRAKLYRFFKESGEAKERGAGDIKLLKHRETGAVRCVMRREQVLKLCANFSVKLVNLSFKKGKDNILIWYCHDYSDPVEHPEGEGVTLIGRFKEAAEANKFKEIIEANQ